MRHSSVRHDALEKEALGNDGEGPNDSLVSVTVCRVCRANDRVEESERLEDEPNFKKSPARQRGLAGNSIHTGSHSEACLSRQPIRYVQEPAESAAGARSTARGSRRGKGGCAVKRGSTRRTDAGRNFDESFARFTGTDFVEREV